MRGLERFISLAYRAVIYPVAACAGPVLLWRRRRAGKDLSSLPERLGLRLPALPAASRRLWVHAVSAGEVMVAERLIAALEAEAAGRVVLSATTAVGLALARSGDHPGPGRVLAAPLDLGWSVRRVQDAVDPAALILLEAELWPGWLGDCRRRGVPVALVNARITERSCRRYLKLRELFRPIVAGLAAIGARGDEDAERLLRMGAREDRLRVTGDFKFDLPAPSIDKAEARRRFRLPATGPVFVAGSIHPGEEEAVEAAFAALRGQRPDAILVVAPRKGLTPPPGAVLRTAAEPVPAGGLLWLDTMGELREAYVAADLAFVGGSLVAVGGHNVLEPAACSVPVLFGPHTAHHAGKAERLLAAGAAIRIDDGDDLARAVVALAGDSGRTQAMGRSGRDAVAAGTGAVARTLELLGPFVRAESCTLRS